MSLPLSHTPPVHPDDIARLQNRVVERFGANFIERPTLVYLALPAAKRTDSWFTEGPQTNVEANFRVWVSFGLEARSTAELAAISNGEQIIAITWSDDKTHRSSNGFLAAARDSHPQAVLVSLCCPCHTSPKEVWKQLRSSDGKSVVDIGIVSSDHVGLYTVHTVIEGLVAQQQALRG